MYLFRYIVRYFFISFVISFIIYVFRSLVSYLLALYCYVYLSLGMYICFFRSLCIGCFFISLFFFIYQRVIYLCIVCSVL